MPSRGVSRAALGMNCPNATTMPRSARRSRSQASAGSSPICSGWRSGAPSSRAAAATGVGSSIRPRPRGRSGCETTPASVCRVSDNARRAGTANSGVPRNTRRSGESAAGMAGALALLLLAPELLLPAPHVQVPLQLADPVDEEHPVEVVDLVLEAERFELGRVELDLLPVQRARAHDHARIALDVGLEVGHRETALHLGGGAALAQHDLGVQQHARVARGILFAP